MNCSRRSYCQKAHTSVSMPTTISPTCGQNSTAAYSMCGRILVASGQCVCAEKQAFTLQRCKSFTVMQEGSFGFTMSKISSRTESTVQLGSSPTSSNFSRIARKKYETYQGRIRLGIPEKQKHARFWCNSHLERTETTAFVHIQQAKEIVK